VLGSKLPIVCLGCGIQFGKTTVGAHKAKLAIHRFTSSDDNFIITAPTYKILAQSTLPAFIKVMAGCGTFMKADMTFKVSGGGTVYFRTGENPDSVVGITNVRFIWGDEAGLYSLYFWENLQARAAFMSAQILLTTSPYTLNWIYREIIRPKLRSADARADVELVQAASWENPHMPKDWIDRSRVTMDPRRFNALFGGKWERMAGLVYDCFDEIENQCEAYALPSGTKYVGGIDWGYTEPFVFKIRAITLEGHHRGVFELYASGLTIAGIIDAVRRAYTTFGVSMIYCGPDQPGYIEELNRHGLHATAANNDVRLGIDRHYELLKTRRLKYFRGTHPYSLDEYETYHYPAPDELKPDEAVKDAKPVQQNDHALDADRYISIMTHAGHLKHVPKVASELPKQEDQFARIERLKRRRKTGTGTEEWS
jgi:hypothetical protein